MNCEHVEERLSAYLDNMLIPEERREVAVHLQTCPRCLASLAELHQNDILLAQLPRVNPLPALRERLLASPELLALTGTTHNHVSHPAEWPCSQQTGSFVEHNDQPRLIPRRGPSTGCLTPRRHARHPSGGYHSQHLTATGRTGDERCDAVERGSLTTFANNRVQHS